MIDYFAPADSAEQEKLRGIKGSVRRRFVENAIQDGGFDSIPSSWKEQEISESLKEFLQGQHPQARGGEDLPNLDEGEVEIARMRLLDSVHGEVTSLRANRDVDSGRINFRMVDEYETEYALPITAAEVPLTAEQVLLMFRDGDPSATETDCAIEFESYFYPDLDSVAGRLGILDGQ